VAARERRQDRRDHARELRWDDLDVPIAPDPQLVARSHGGPDRGAIRRDREDDPVLLFDDRSDP